jgi:hypothetical protein
MALPEEKTNSTPDWLTAGSTRIDKPVTEIRGGSIFIPKEPEKPEEKFVTLTPEEAAIERLDPTGVYQRSTTTDKIFRLEGPEKGPKLFPEKAADTLTDDVNQVDALSRALRGFNDDFAGSAFTSIESLLQGWNSDIGTPGQRDWWADVKSSDNIIRNKLFGASLTPGEQQAYAQTTITPSMDGTEIKKNLLRRLEIVQKATQRRYNRYVAAGYDPAQIDATIGDVNFRELPSLEPEAQPDGQEETTLIEFETNPDLVVGMDGRVYDKRTGQPVELPQQGGASIGESLYAAGGDIAQTAGDVLGLVGNPANAAVNALFGTNLSTNLGETFREATGAPRGDPLASAINRGLGAAMTGLGSASLAARTLPQAGRQIAATLTELPTQQIIGGGTGAAASELTRQAGGGPVAQTIAGITAGVTPASVSNLARPRNVPAPSTAAPATTSTMESLISPPTGRDIIRAGEQANIPIMTSDIRQPTTFLGATAQRAGERIPLVGTGGARATQQQARQDAVKDFLIENAGTIPDDVQARLVADVSRKNADAVKKYTDAKKEVFANVSTAGTVPTNNTLKAIDDQITELSKLRTDAADEAVIKLQELREKLGDRDVYQMESYRKDELANAWRDTNLSIGASNRVQTAVKNLYKPFNEDLGKFILQNGGKNDYTKWRVSNARLSDGLEEAKRSTLKAILRNGEATPDLIDKMLFSSKKSDVSALYRSLTPEGQSLARMAIVSKVADEIGAAQGISPEKFMTKMINKADQIGVFFSKGQQQEIKGLIQALNATRRGGSAAVQTQSGQENYIPLVLSTLGAGTGVAADVLTTGGTGTALAAAFTAAVRTYESKPVRNLFAALSKTKSGSEQEQVIIGKINEKFAPLVATISSVEAEAEKAKKEQRMEMPQ